MKLIQNKVFGTRTNLWGCLIYTSVYRWDIWSPEINDLPRVMELGPCEAYLILSPVLFKWATVLTAKQIAQALLLNHYNNKNLFIVLAGVAQCLSIDPGIKRLMVQFPAHKLHPQWRRQPTDVTISLFSLLSVPLSLK